MKKLTLLLLAALLLISALSACGDAGAPAASWTCADGRARPSSCGQLQVKDGKLCDAQGEPVFAPVSESGLRFHTIYGSTVGDGNTGEFIVLTNILDRAVDLNGLSIWSEKTDKELTKLVCAALDTGQSVAHRTYPQATVGGDGHTRYLQTGQRTVIVEDTPVACSIPDLSAVGLCDGSNVSVVCCAEAIDIVTCVSDASLLRSHPQKVSVIDIKTLDTDSAA